MTTPDTTIQPGDRVRSFDFESRDLAGENARYIEGEVTGFDRMEGCDRYAIRVTKVVWGRVVTQEPGMGYTYPPVNGTPTTLGRVCDSVEKI